ncbi:MAG: HEAT repeat domain-containing protein [Proteobacteria bacterium]|nr:HEAT repeat domain-containing protein [Pseudomonadota bacterium]
MGLKDFFGGFSAEAREQKQFDKMVGKLVSRNYQSEDRMFVIEALARMDTPEATAALFRRFDMTSDKKREDVAEKEMLSDLLAAKGIAILPHVQVHNDRSPNITLPLRTLMRVAGDGDVMTELIRILEKEQARLAAFKPEKKLRVLELMQDYPEDERLTASILPGVADFDADVRFETIRLLGQYGDDSAREPLLNRLCDPEEDSRRVTDAIVQALHSRAWKVTDRKDELPELGDAWRIGPKGTVIVAD